ncbi:hypothetical protein [Nocardia jiangxiensis]|uniref:Uncharacterized protein n=1 Tax=Nocardia jiangxiensis TaxID=282685 RepID=A0ABW6RYG7_9NOCA|nr:hypothetical protein [Nocardia jiangxiensis]
MNGPETYSWEITYTRFDGTSRVDHGGGQFGSPEEVTGRICRTFVEVGTALFDITCDDVTEQHYHDVLDARVEDRPDPGQPFEHLGAVILDHEGAERMSLTARLVYRSVTEAAVEEYREQLEEWERRDTERRARRAKAAADAGRPSIQPLDPRLRSLISNLQVEADTVREEIFTPDHCREQLALAENTVAAAMAAQNAAEAGGNVAEAAHARAYIQRWRPRITRWASMLELTTEAYMDAAAVDAEAERLANIPPSPV